MKYQPKAFIVGDIVDCKIKIGRGCYRQGERRGKIIKEIGPDFYMVRFDSSVDPDRRYHAKNSGDWQCFAKDLVLITPMPRPTNEEILAKIIKQNHGK